MTVGSKARNSCLDLDPENKKLFVNQCDRNNDNMKWEWGFINETALADFDNFGWTPQRQDNN